MTGVVIAPQNAYLHALVLPSSQHVPRATERAFSAAGRMSSISSDRVRSWPEGLAFQPFASRTTSREFKYCKRAVPLGAERVASNLSAVWTPHFQEVLINGTLQGRKQFDRRGASMLCRQSIWRLATQVADLAGSTVCTKTLMKKTYSDVKQDEALDGKRQIKEDVIGFALKGWSRSNADQDFGL